MSESKHTPGPWTFSDAEPSRKYIYGEVTRDGFRGRPRIAVTEFGLNYGQHIEEETLANARLIAAAPDLLEALKAVVSLKGWDEREPVSVTGRQALAAIAKAEGRS